VWPMVCGSFRHGVDSLYRLMRDTRSWWRASSDALHCHLRGLGLSEDAVRIAAAWRCSTPSLIHDDMRTVLNRRGKAACTWSGIRWRST
jgi:hypothetical protein